MSKSAPRRKLTEQGRNLLSQAFKGINNPHYGKNHSEETKAQIRAARLGKSYLSESTKARMSEERGIAAIRVIDLETNETSVYTSLKKAAEAMGITRPLLSMRFKPKAHL
jgi:group I intron endonuclease